MALRLLALLPLLSLVHGASISETMRLKFEAFATEQRIKLISEQLTKECPEIFGGNSGGAFGKRDEDLAMKVELDKQFLSYLTETLKECREQKTTTSKDSSTTSPTSTTESTTPTTASTTSSTTSTTPTTTSTTSTTESTTPTTTSTTSSTTSTTPTTTSTTSTTESTTPTTTSTTSSTTSTTPTTTSTTSTTESTTPTTTSTTSSTTSTTPTTTSTTSSTTSTTPTTTSTTSTTESTTPTTTSTTSSTTSTTPTTTSTTSTTESTTPSTTSTTSSTTSTTPTTTSTTSTTESTTPTTTSTTKSPVDSGPPPQCLSPAVNLLEPWRNHYTGPYMPNSDINILKPQETWFRFLGPAGTKVRDTCPTQFECGSSGAYWSMDPMPAAAGESKVITLFESLRQPGGSSSDCTSYGSIKAVATKCSEFGDYIYQLLEPFNSAEDTICGTN